MKIQSGRTVFRNGSTVYDCLEFLPPGLMLDIGAAAGYATQLMLSKSPESEVMAFEPFPGNFKHFFGVIGDDPRVTLFKKAVAEQSGTMLFRLGKTVQGSEPGWSHLRGYSSLGHLVKRQEATPLVKSLLKKLLFFILRDYFPPMRMR